jgi:hypothetical protein
MKELKEAAISALRELADFRKRLKTLEAQAAKATQALSEAELNLAACESAKNRELKLHINGTASASNLDKARRAVEVAARTKSDCTEYLEATYELLAELKSTLPKLEKRALNEESAFWRRRFEEEAAALKISEDKLLELQDFLFLSNTPFSFETITQAIVPRPAGNSLEHRRETRQSEFGDFVS